LPGVESVAIAHVVPLNGHLTNGADLTSDRGRTVHVNFNTNYVSPAYFQVMQIPLVAGRAFQASDRHGAPRVAILNENMARAIFENDDPVGHTLRFGKGSPILIAGVAKN